MYGLLFKSFFRTKIFTVSLILLTTVGLISILIGKQFLEKQEKTILAAQKFQEKSIERNIEYHGDELGLLLYYVRFTLIKEPSNISAISIGQSDVNPPLQAVTIRGLEGQKYDTDFENPALLMSGNLDLGFVIIYLFPLVLIAMTFNLYSEEKEMGTWHLLASQTSGKAGFLMKKFVVRFSFLLIILVLLLFLASGILRISMNGEFWAVLLQSILYLLFWGTLCLWVISFQKSSSFNALGLISIWVVLTILIPAAVNNYVLNKYKVPEALQAMVEQRDGYHNKWDLEKDVTMDVFFNEYPQYQKYAVPQEEFSWLWYYGMQHMGDVEARETALEMKEKLISRERVSQQAALFIPTIHAQLSMNKLAGTDMASHQLFLEKLTEFHERLRMEFYPKIFEGKSATSVAWEKHDSKFVDIKAKIEWVFLLLPTLIIILVLGTLSWLSLRKF